MPSRKLDMQSPKIRARLLRTFHARFRLRKLARRLRNQFRLRKLATVFLHRMQRAFKQKRRNPRKELAKENQFSKTNLFTGHVAGRLWAGLSQSWFGSRKISGDASL